MSSIIFKNPTHTHTPFYLHPKLFHPLDLGRPILNENSTLSKKLWKNNHTVHLNERKQNKDKTKLTNHIDHVFYGSI